MMGHIFARSQRGPSDDVEEKSARLEDKEKKPAKLKASQKGQKGHRKTSDLDGERKRDGKHAGPKESSEGRSDDLEHRKAKNGADAAVYAAPSLRRSPIDPSSIHTFFRRRSLTPSAL